MLLFSGRFCLAGSLLLALLAAARAEAADWKSGAELRRTLESTVEITWRENPLAKGVARLSEQTGVAIWLDRRLDPDQRVTFATSEVRGAARLETTLAALAAKVNAGMARVGSVVYVGPPETAARLATVAIERADRIRQLEPALRGAWLKSAPLQFDELSTPRELLEHWSTATGLKVTNLDVVPHDLWRAGDYPSLTAVERLTLLLAGFDLSFEPAADGRSLSLVPMPEVKTVERVYTSDNAASTMAQLKQLYPTAAITAATAGKFTFRGTAEQHEQVERLLRGERVVRGTVTGETRYTLKIENQPLAGVGRALATKLKLEFHLDPSLAEKSGQLISFEVKDATLDQLLAALADSASVSCRAEAGKLTVGPK